MCKNGKGWIKGKEVCSFDLLCRDFLSFFLDGCIVVFVVNLSYLFDEDYFGEF